MRFARLITLNAFATHAHVSELVAKHTVSAQDTVQQAFLDKHDKLAEMQVSRARASGAWLLYRKDLEQTTLGKLPRELGRPLGTTSDTAIAAGSRWHRLSGAGKCRYTRISTSDRADVAAESYRPSSVEPMRSVAGMFLAATFLCGNLMPAALADTDYNVRLEDVQSPETRAAVRASEQGDFRVAEDLFRQQTEKEPEWASAWSNLGNTELLLGKTEDALEHFTRAVELAPQAPVPLLNRALALEKLGVRAALERAPGDPGPEAEAFWQRASRDCDAAIALDPKEFAAHFNKANVLLRQADYPAALGEYETAARLAPGLAGYRLKVAEVLFEMGRDAEAEKMTANLVRKYPAYDEARAALAAMRWSRGAQLEAEDAWFPVAERSWGRSPQLARPSYDFARELLWPPKLAAAVSSFVRIYGISEPKRAEPAQQPSTAVARTPVNAL